MHDDAQHQSLDPEIAAAQRNWERLADVLRARERLLVSEVGKHTRDGTPFPHQVFSDVKAARAECNAAFVHLMDLIECRTSGVW